GENIDAGCKQVVCDIARDAKTPRSVFTIGDDEFDVEALAQARQLGCEHIAAGLSDDIADEKKAHRLLIHSAWKKRKSGAAGGLGLWRRLPRALFRHQPVK